MSEMAGTEASREDYGEYSVDDEDQLQPEDTLMDRGLEDALDEGYSPLEREPAHLRFGTTPEEARQGESLDQRLEQEVPETDPYLQAEEEARTQADDPDAWPDDATADARSGRLVAPDEGVRRDGEHAPLAQDVGIDGAGASAEEAAMHVTGEL